MHLRLITLRFSPALGHFEDEPLRELLADKQLLRFSEHFFTVDGTPFVTLLLSWCDSTLAPHAGGVRAKSSRKARTVDDPTKELNPTQHALFETLRAWRAERAREEGAPPYVVFTNKQLVAIIQSRPRNATALGNLDGIGYVQQDREEMEVLFTFLAERYERKSVMVTSNLVFSQWDRILKDAMTTVAAIDRLVHHSTILEMTGTSFRSAGKAVPTESVVALSVSPTGSCVIVIRSSLQRARGREQPRNLSPSVCSQPVSWQAGSGGVR